ncbi:MAG: hypothetical protein ACO1TE_13115 [Prosthecobacter sp.]
MMTPAQVRAQADHWGTPIKVRVLGSARGEGSFVRQQSSLGRYGHVILEVAASPNDGITFQWNVEETTIPKIFAEAVLRGIQRACADHKAFAGCSLTRTTVRVIDGSFHEADSNGISYERAAYEAFESAVRQAGGLFLAD